MGMSCSPNIFQSKTYEFLGDIRGLKLYMEDILVIKKGTFLRHFEQPKNCLNIVKT